MTIETPLIGSGSQEEVENRVNALVAMGTERGYITYEELNERLPDELVSPDKLDTLLMMIDEMGIKLIDEDGISEFQTKPSPAATKAAKLSLAGTAVPPPSSARQQEKAAADADRLLAQFAAEEEEDLDLDLEKELEEAQT